MILYGLIRKPASLLAICFIIIACLLAVFAVQISPDNSPHANRMIIELGAREPGFSMNFVKIPRQVTENKPSLLSRWFAGAPSTHSYLPVVSYNLEGKTLQAHHYIDDGITDTLEFSIQALVPEALRNAPIPQQQKWVEKHAITQQTFLLGTDKYGRDILSRLIYGTRVSLAAGLVAVILSLSIGILLGSLAGYYGGKVDALIMWLVNILWSIPTLLLVFAITFAFGKGFWSVFIAMGLTMWIGAARLIRGQVMVIREMEFITAAKASGISNLRILFRHVLPNVAGPVMVMGASNFATAILIEAGLSFLGIGVQPPHPSWGLMIKEHYNFLLTGRAMLAFIPGIAIMILVFAFNILGNALRDLLDVRSQKNN